MQTATKMSIASAPIVAWRRTCLDIAHPLYPSCSLARQGGPSLAAWQLYSQFWAPSRRRKHALPSMRLVSFDGLIGTTRESDSRPQLEYRPRQSDDPSHSEIVRAVRAAWSAATAALRLTQQYRRLHSGAEHGSRTGCHRHGNHPPERYAQRTFKRRRAAHGRGGNAKQGQKDHRRRHDPIEQALLRRQ